MHMRKIALFILVSFAFFLRIYNISHIPPALSWDEVSIGYNAYSILKTGRDEHGKFMPLDAFIAYGDYKPPLAIYLTVPSIAVFGLNEFGVRFPSAFFGTLTIFITYFLVKELFRKKLEGLSTLRTFNLPAIASLLLAISPWHINLSRAGFEANIALFFVVLGTYLVLSSREKSYAWYVAWLPFVAAMYTFNSARYFCPIFALGLVWFCLKEIRKNIRVVIIGIVIAVLTALPMVPHLVSREARLRFTEVNIFTDSSIVKIANERIERQKGSLIGKIVNNRRIGYARSYLIHFFDHFQPEFLFGKGDGNPKFSIQDVGQLYTIEAPLLIIGIFALLLADVNIGLLLLFWIVSAIIPAATARETPHALRILNSLPTWHIFIAYGIITILSYIKKISVKRIFLLFLVALYVFSVVYYLHNYYRHYAVEFSGEWQYGYREAIHEIQPIMDKYNKVVITENIGRPYMYTLFYTKTDPDVFMRTKDASFDEAGFYHVYGFVKYRFGGTLTAALEEKTLYVWGAGTVQGWARVIRSIPLLNGNPNLVIFDSGEVNL